MTCANNSRRIGGYEDVVCDPGERDKRLLLFEQEFVSVLKTADRDGNTLSAIIRQAWDTGALRILNKNTPARSTGAHISILGHITHEELSRYLTATEQANGFANRFLWVAVRRSQLLPDGGNVLQAVTPALIQQICDAVRVARTIEEVRRDAIAGELWHEVPTFDSGQERSVRGSHSGYAPRVLIRCA